MAAFIWLRIALMSIHNFRGLFFSAVFFLVEMSCPQLIHAKKESGA
jgi:hypothetical protein